MYSVVSARPSSAGLGSLPRAFRRGYVSGSLKSGEAVCIAAVAVVAALMPLMCCFSPSWPLQTDLRNLPSGKLNLNMPVIVKKMAFGAGAVCDKCYRHSQTSVTGTARNLQRSSRSETDLKFESCTVQRVCSTPERGRRDQVITLELTCCRTQDPSHSSEGCTVDVSSPNRRSQELPDINSR
jgi:hypothetical protein